MLSEMSLIFRCPKRAVDYDGVDCPPKSQNTRA